jgi:hypothetical protein
MICTIILYYNVYIRRRYSDYIITQWCVLPIRCLLAMVSFTRDDNRNIIAGFPSHRTYIRALRQSAISIRDYYNVVSLIIYYVPCACVYSYVAPLHTYTKAHALSRDYNISYYYYMDTYGWAT